MRLGYPALLELYMPEKQEKRLAALVGLVIGTGFLMISTLAGVAPWQLGKYLFATLTWLALAVALSAVAGYYFFLPPYHTWVHTRATLAARAGIEWGAFHVVRSAVADGGVFAAACLSGPATSPSLALGAAAGLLGDKWNLGFLAETEHQVGGHLQSHLGSLPAQDGKSRAVVEQMYVDETRHSEMAKELGGAELPPPVKLAIGTRSAPLHTQMRHLSSGSLVGQRPD